MKMAFGLVLLLASSPALAANCEIGAFGAGTDPSGTNVRAEPGRAGKVLATLPAARESGARIEFEISDAKDGWFKVHGIRDNAVLDERPPRQLYAGSGWVSGKLLTVKSQSFAGYEKPDQKSKVLYAVKDDEPAFDTDEKMDQVRLIDCRGKWARIEYKNKKFWLDKICALQETSCSGF